MKKALTLTAAALVAASCGPPDTFDRSQMLTDTVDGVIAPTHEELSTTSDALQTAVSDFCDGDRTGDQLDAAREAWKDLQGPLKRIQAWSFNMSPYRGASFETPVYKVDREPSWGDNIEAVIAAGDARYRQDLNVDGDEKPDKPFADRSDETIDAEFIAQQSYLRNAQGFPAVEYLLFGNKEGTGMGELYMKDNEQADRRCAYLTAATEHANGIVDGYTDAWSPDGGNFAGTFQQASPENMDWTTVQDSVNAMVSQMVFISKQRLSKNLLGGPLGQHSDNAKVPDEVSSPHAETSVAQLEQTLQGLDDIYSGGSGRTLADYTKFRKASIHETVRKRIDEARTAIQEIPAPLHKAVDENTGKVEAAQAAVDELTKVIEADLKTTLGASTTRVVVDND